MRIFDQGIEAMIVIQIPGVPVGKGRPRFARRGAFVQTYSPEKTQNYEAVVRMAAMDAMQGRPPLDVPLRVNLDIVMPVPASFSRKKRDAALADDIRPTTKPDVDNVMKGVLDAMNSIVWVDDKQIVSGTFEKRYGLTPCVIVTVTEWTGNG